LFTRQRCALLLLVAVAAIWIFGCTEDSISGASYSKVPYTTGSFTDGRDGKTYKTTKIRNQTWMAENLNYQTTNGSWCYGNSTDSCDKYGRLYDWNTAMVSCLSGWHLPSRKEWYDLTAAIGGSDVAAKKLKATSGWDNNGNGTDDYEFSALPGGVYIYLDIYQYGSFALSGSQGLWWTATEDSRDDDGNPYIRQIADNYDIVAERSISKKAYGHSVRCLQN
jgi:uncharacterized protein (TIGR02145 family)